MVIQEDKKRLKALLAETITLLCKNGLNYKSKFCIEALIGITLDDDDVFLVSIKETVKSLTEEVESALAAATSTQSSRVRDDEISSHNKNNRESHTPGKHKQSTPGSRRRSHGRESPKHYKSENSSHTPAKRSASEASATDMPSLSLDDMQGEGDEYWKSITTPGSESESRDSFARTKEDLCDEPPMKRQQRDSDNELVDAKCEQTSSSGDVEDMPVVIKHEPDSDIEEIEDSFIPGHYSGVEGDMSMAGPSQGMLPMPGMQHGQMGPMSVQQGGANVWQGAGGIPTAAAGAPGQHEETSTGHCHVSSAATSDVRSSQCQLCGVSISAHNLQKHVEIMHLGQYRLRCPICNKGFSNKYNLKGHMASHTGQTDIHCSVCGKKFNYPHVLKRHVKTVHGNVVLNTTVR